jgi:methyl-accepting chemotaxis protein
MQFWANLGIRAKILIAAGSLVVASFGIGLVAFIQMSAMDATAKEIRKEWLPSLVKLSAMRAAVDNYRIKEGRYLLTLVVDKSKMADLDRDLSNSATTVESAFSGYKPYIKAGTDDERLTNEFANLWTKFRAASLNTIETAKNGDLPEAVRLFSTTDLAARRAMASVVEKDLAFNVGEGEIAAEASEAIFFKSRQMLLATLALAAALGAATSFILIAGVVSPVRRVTAALGKLAAGDLSVEVGGAERQDEIGFLVRSLNVFREAIAERERLEDTARAERQNELRRQTMLEQLVGRFRSLVSEVVMSVDSEADAMSGTAQTLNDVAFQAEQTAGAARSAVSDSSVNIQAVSAAAEELTASIAEISKQIKGASERASHATNIARQTDQGISGLVELADKIGAIVEIIRTIAQQTNLLALNATIEAARAGDAGRGFAVVASEVKTLAGSTAKATDEIAAQIAAIQAATHSAVKEIQAIAVAVAEIDTMTNAVAGSVEQQSEATGEIARAISAASASSANASKNVEQVASVINQTNSEAGRVSNATGLLSTSAKKLAEAVDAFLHDVTQDVKNRRMDVRRRSTQGIVIGGDGNRIKTKLVDISDTGAKIVAAGDFRNGQQFSIEFEDQARVTAKVVWLKDGFAGVQFDQPLSAIAGKKAAG